jgi:hypothetical protein
MKIIKRYLKQEIEKDALVKNKMAFITGPRQVGKSTLARSFITNDENYFLYDDDKFRLKWIKSPSDSIQTGNQQPIILDEIHKDRKWKNKVKGIYDQNKDRLKLIITGSARLDFYRKGSDSLLGRYLPYRLHPFTMAENLDSIAPDKILHSRNIQFPWKDLLVLGGFPEPLLTGQENEAQRWSRLRLDRLISEDSRDFRNISDINAFRVLTDLLPERVGSLLSINSLKEDVGKAYATVRDWMQILNILYYIVLIKPYSKKIKRVIKAEPKMFLYDITRIPKEMNSKRLENLTALHLLKACNYWTDLAHGEFELNFIRNKDQREVDFLIIKNKQPWMLIECKSNSKSISSNLYFFKNLLNTTLNYQLITGKNYHKFYSKENIHIIDYSSFFQGWL